MSYSIEDTKQLTMSDILLHLQLQWMLSQVVRKLMKGHKKEKQKRLRLTPGQNCFCSHKKNSDRSNSTSLRHTPVQPDWQKPLKNLNTSSPRQDVPAMNRPHVTYVNWGGFIWVPIMHICLSCYVPPEDETQCCGGGWVRVCIYSDLFSNRSWRMRPQIKSNEGRRCCSLTCGIRLTWMLQKFSLFTLNWNCLKASMKGILSMSPTVPPNCKKTQLHVTSYNHGGLCLSKSLMQLSKIIKQKPHYAARLTSITQTWGSTSSSSTGTLACFTTHSWMASVMCGTTGKKERGTPKLIMADHFSSPWHPLPETNSSHLPCTVLPR